MNVRTVVTAAVAIVLVGAAAVLSAYPTQAQARRQRRKEGQETFGPR